jgi:hypothetical protein
MCEKSVAVAAPVCFKRTPPGPVASMMKGWNRQVRAEPGEATLGIAFAVPGIDPQNPFEWSGSRDAF